MGNTRHFDNGIEGGLKFFANDPLVAQPGTHFNYSTQGYTVAGCAIEGASGQNTGRRARDCSHSGWHVADASRRALRYRAVPHALLLKGQIRRRDERGISRCQLQSSRRGWLSSAPDMARFEAATNNRLLKRPTRDTMWTQPMPSDGLGRLAYGLGWQFGAVEDVKIVGHGGSQQGTSTMIWMAPDARAGVVVLTNSDSSNAPRLAIQLLRIVLGFLNTSAQRSLWIRRCSTASGKLAVGDFKVTIAREGDRLSAQIRDQKYSLSPESVREHVLKGTDAHLILSVDRNGRPELIMRESGIDAYLNLVK